MKKEKLIELIEEVISEVLDEKKKRKKRKKKVKVKKDACYRKVKSRYKVWPSAYASGALVKCRKVGAKNWGNSKKNEEVTPEEEEDLKNVSKELAGASKMHKKQSDRIKKALKSEQKKNCGCGQDPCKTYGIQETKEVAEDLRKWFRRKGEKGSKGGWVDCNAPDGDGGYKACSPGEGEKRKRYPACRPTPARCKDPGKGTKWGKKSGKKK